MSLNDELFAKLIVDHVCDGIVLSNSLGRTVWVNPAFTRISGYFLEDILGKKPGDVLQGPATSAESKKTLSIAIANLTSCTVDIVNYTKSGDAYISELKLSPIFDEQGDIEYFVAVQRDVTLQRALTQQSIDFKAYQRALDKQAIVSVADPQGNIVYVNTKFCIISGYASDELIGKNHRLINSRTHPRSFFDIMWTEISQGNTWHGEVCNRSKSGTLYWVDTTIVPVHSSDGEILRYISTRYDITERKVAENELIRVANIDKLTGLSNRSRFNDEINNRIKNAKQAQSSCNELLIIFDLDHFKDLNDTLGHHYGDMLLKEISRRLVFLCGINAIVARVGGDEFAAIVPIGDITETQVTALVKQLHTSASEMLLLSDHAYTPSFSMGVTRYPADAKTVESLIINADIALYEAKKNGRNRWCFFDITVKQKFEQRKHIKDLLNKALANNSFTIVMQPICSMKTAAHTGFEVLVRLSEQGKPIPPDQFIPLAEELGLIIPIGQVVMRKAMAAMRKMLDMGLKPGKIALNVAAPQFQKPDFVSSIEKMLLEYGIEPSMLIIEITETALIGRSSQSVAKALSELHALGIKIALDDFGTGFSSLSHLRDFNVDKIKIDKSFIQDLEYNRDDRALVEGLISFGIKLGLEVVAEGVETQTQLQLLQDYECQYLQGYLHSRPLIIEDAITFLQEQDAT